MSQLTPSADPLRDAIIPGSPPPESQSWSALAIAGFVLSLVGCLGITAILGLILGVAGIAKTRGGRRRGYGLAVAAIPISIVTGALCLGGLYYAKKVGVVYMARINAVKDVVGSTPDEAAAAFATFRKGCAEGFVVKASDELLTVWLASVREKHGSLVSIDTTPMPLQGGGGLQINAKFVNGPAPIVFRFSKASQTQMLIDYLEVDGLALGESP